MADRVITLPRVNGPGGLRIRRPNDIDPVFTGSHPIMGDEFNGKMPQWIDVTTLGIVGDGVTDNTTALQIALNSLNSDTRPVLYFPSGTYGISQNNVLYLGERIDVALIGEDPLTTKFKYIGPNIINDNKWLIRIDGVAYSKISRFTFDGDNKIKILINQEWSGSHNYFDTGNEYSDIRFENARVGIDIGWGYYGGAETAVMRCHFRNLTENGISLGNFNALDMWVWDSLFEDNNRGINGAYGNFHVFNSIFKRNTIDMHIQSTSTYSVKGCYSEDSYEFFAAGNSQNSAQVLLQDNVVVRPISRFIRYGNYGALTLYNNLIIARTDVVANPYEFGWVGSFEGAVIIYDIDGVPTGKFTGDLISMNNRYTHPEAIHVRYPSQYVRHLQLNDELIPHMEVTAPVWAGFQQKIVRQVFEVPAGSSASAIQTIINTAYQFNGQRPIVYFPFSDYPVNTQLVIPPSDLQLVGDGASSKLTWNGAFNLTTSMLKLLGPSKVTIKNLKVSSSGLTQGIIIQNADQINGRVYMHQLEASFNAISSLTVNNLNNAKVYAVNSGFYYNGTGTAIKAQGGGQGEGQTLIIGCQGASDVGAQFGTSGGANLFIGPYWCESGSQSNFATLTGSGKFTMVSGLLANPSDPYGTIKVDGFNGEVTVANTFFYDKMGVTGDGTNTKVLSIGCMVSTLPHWVDDSNPAAQAALLNTTREAYQSEVGVGEGNGYQVPNVGTVSNQFIIDMMKNLEVALPNLNKLADGVTDVRMFRVGLTGCQGGIIIN